MVVDGSDYSEDALIERPAIALFGELGWETADCFHEFEQPGGRLLGRETAAEVVLIPRLRRALEKLNPKAPAEAIAQAIEETSATPVRDKAELVEMLGQRSRRRWPSAGVWASRPRSCSSPRGSTG